MFVCLVIFTVEPFLSPLLHNPVIVMVPIPVTRVLSKICLLVLTRVRTIFFSYGRNKLHFKVKMGRKLKAATLNASNCGVQKKKKKLNVIIKCNGNNIIFANCFYDNSEVKFTILSLKELQSNIPLNCQRLVWFDTNGATSENERAGLSYTLNR